MLKYNPKLKRLSRNLRTNLTKPERILWQHLRRNQVHGLRFSRQKPIGNYILDFYCHKIKLAIELDGDQHFYEKGKIKDEKRTIYLNSVGIELIRFPNNEIYKNLETVLDKIYQVVEFRLKPENPLTPPSKRGK